MSAPPSSGMIPVQLACEYRTDPMGLDVAAPRLGWVLRSAQPEKRGLLQAAYQIQAASTPAELEREQGLLWDSGRVASRETQGIAYGGRALGSRQHCWWHVRVWDQDGRASAWSAPAQWTMGLLHPGDWRAAWVTHPVLADPENRPLIPLHCYRSALATDPDQAKWIVIDLGAAKKMDGVRLWPARPTGQRADISTVLYPLRYRVEAANRPDFADAETVADETGRDLIAPRPVRIPLLRHRFGPIQARYIRLTVTRLAHWAGIDYGIALGLFEVLDDERNLAVGAEVTCSDSLEEGPWSKRFLVGDQARVETAPVPPVLPVEVPGIPAQRTVSRTPFLRREFAPGAAVVRALLHVTARGFYEIRINGRRVGDELLAPGFTEFDRRLQVQTHDVTSLLRPGPNAIGALLGYGWYASQLNLHENRYTYGFFPQLLAQLELELEDGRIETVATDALWRTSLSGPVLCSDLLDGEAYDARKEWPGWDRAGFDDRSWDAATVFPRDAVRLSWQRSQPVRAVSEWRPVAVREPTPGVHVFDFGTEISGWCRLRTGGPAGAQVTLRHGEMVKPDGSLDAKSLWGILQREDYILDGGPPRSFEPRFTYHGFRYVELSGLPGLPEPDTLTAIELHTDAPEAGRFECSNELFNRLMRAAGRTQDNLLFDVPAGCAARGERLAWLGDIRPCVQSLLFRRNAAAFFEKYLVDIRDSQLPDGRFADISPRGHTRNTEMTAGAPGWGDAGVTLPWDLYLHTGDRRILAQHFDAARRWVGYILAHNPDLLWKNHPGNNYNWGDWLHAGGTAMPKEVGATAFFAHDADLLSRMAAVLGRDEEAAFYRDLFARIKEAFNRAYVSEDGAIEGDAQGCYALALLHGLIDESMKPQVLRRFAESLRRAGGHPTTGFWSSDALVEALSQNGLHALAAETMNLTTRPSWGHMATAGTTFWENWGNSMKGPEGNGGSSEWGDSTSGYPEESIESLNHWTYSAVAEWLWRHIAGLSPDPAEPGFSWFVIRPRPCRQVDWCRASHDSVRGTIRIDWQRKDGFFRLRLAVPPNTTATVHLPTSNPATVTESGRPARESPGVALLAPEDGTARFRVPSGDYLFEAECALDFR